MIPWQWLIGAFIFGCMFGALIFAAVEALRSYIEVRRLSR